MTPTPAVDSRFSTSPDRGGWASRDEARCRAAATSEERALHHRLRRAVFVDEQGLFAGDDRDARDNEPATILALGFCGDIAAGAVRLYPVGDGWWKGDRLAVLPAYRTHHVGAPLVRFAVRTAAARDGRRMFAHVQPPVVRFFERLGWERVGDPITYVGRAHQRMEIEVADHPLLRGQ